MDQFQSRTLFGDIGACIGFYTRLPSPWSSEPDRRFADAQWAAPLAGLVVGVLAAFAFWLALRLGLPSTVAAVFALAAAMLVTGCLHEDGLADLADGLGGGTTAGQKLAIMRDSRIGTYGVSVLAISMLVKWSALAAFTTASAALVALLTAHMASRAIIPAFMHIVARARDDGLSASVGHIDAKTALAAIGIGIVALLLLGVFAAFLAAALLAIWFLVLRVIVERQIGGQTGDVLGALQQGGEVVVLLVACSLLA